MVEEQTPHPTFEISCVDEATVKYTESGRHILIDVELQQGLISTERIIHTNSIDLWIDPEDGSSVPVSTIDRKVITYRLQGSHPLRRKKFRIEEDSPD